MTVALRISGKLLSVSGCKANDKLFYNLAFAGPTTTVAPMLRSEISLFPTILSHLSQTTDKEAVRPKGVWINRQCTFVDFLSH